ncbi:MAG: TolC family protein, partial [Clostridia bacterium]|nr:TolC family protein [Clostridia bacterium]
EEAAREAYYQLQYTLPRENGYFLYDPDDPTTLKAEQSYYGYLAAQARTETGQKQLQVAADRVVADVHKKYFAVLEARQALESALAGAAGAEAAAQAARARYQAGMISQLELDQAEQDRMDAEKNAADAKAALEQAYRSLNDLLGLPSTARPVLTEEVVFSPVEPIDNLAAYARSVLAQDPVLWQLQRGVDLEKTLSGQPGTDEERAALKIEQASLDRDRYRRQMEQAIPEIYEGILQMERQCKTLEQALATARESLRVAELSYQVGLATQADVLAARAGVARAEEALLRLAVQHRLAKLRLAKPWLDAAGSAGA